MKKEFQSTSEVKKMQLHLGGVRPNKGFTLVEILVVISVLSVVGVIILTIFTRTLKGNNKAQILSAIKQNGQAVLENMDKTIRGADNLVCISTGKDTIVIVQGGVYTRYRFVAPIPDTANGLIQQSNPVQPASGNNSDIKLFKDKVCTDPMETDSPIVQVLTDTGLQSGVSVENGSFDNKNPSSGFKDTITINFQLAHALKAPPAVAGQIDPVTFQTTIQLR